MQRTDLQTFDGRQTGFSYPSEDSSYTLRYSQKPPGDLTLGEEFSFQVEVSLGSDAQEQQITYSIGLETIEITGEDEVRFVDSNTVTVAPGETVTVDHNMTINTGSSGSGMWLDLFKGTGLTAELWASALVYFHESAPDGSDTSPDEPWIVGHGIEAGTDEAVVGETVRVGFTAKNAGDAHGTKTFGVAVNGVHVFDIEYSLHPGSTETKYVDVNVPDAPEMDIRMGGASTTVGTNSELEFQEVWAEPSAPMRGGTVTLYTTIKNVSSNDITTSFPVYVMEEAVGTKQVSIGGGATRQLSVEADVPLNAYVFTANIGPAQFAMGTKKPENMTELQIEQAISRASSWFSNNPAKAVGLGISTIAALSRLGGGGQQWR